MRVVVDTNILVSALLSARSLPAELIELWRESRFDLLTSTEQVDELKRVTRYPKIRERLSPTLGECSREHEHDKRTSEARS